MALRISRFDLQKKGLCLSVLGSGGFFRYRCVPGHNVLSPIYPTPMKREPISYEEKHGYENPLERDFWSDRATRIICRAVALVALVFSVLFAFEIL